MGLVAPRQWNISGPGIKSVSPALAGGFFTTEPPGKPHPFLLNVSLQWLVRMGFISILCQCFVLILHSSLRLLVYTANVFFNYAFCGFRMLHRALHDLVHNNGTLCAGMLHSQISCFHNSKWFPTCDVVLIIVACSWFPFSWDACFHTVYLAPSHSVQLCMDFLFCSWSFLISLLSSSTKLRAFLHILLMFCNISDCTPLILFIFVFVYVSSVRQCYPWKQD